MKRTVKRPAGVKGQWDLVVDGVVVASAKLSKKSEAGMHAWQITPTADPGYILMETRTDKEAVRFLRNLVQPERKVSEVPGDLRGVKARLHREAQERREAAKADPFAIFPKPVDSLEAEVEAAKPKPKLQRLTVVWPEGIVHARGCRDIKVDVQKQGRGHGGTENIEAASKRDAAAIMWSDQIHDTVTEDDEDYFKVVDEYATFTAWKPCVHLPEK